LSSKLVQNSTALNFVGEKDGKSQEWRTQEREDQPGLLDIDHVPASSIFASIEVPVERNESVTSMSSLTTTQKPLTFSGLKRVRSRKSWTEAEKEAVKRQMSKF
jgi:hypothetical protein